MNQVITDTIDKSKLPKHVAIIMDGNGRWAKAQGFDRTFGHQNAIESVRSAIDSCGELGIDYLTLYAFSTENWNRPKTEVVFLMNLLKKTIKSELNELHEKGIRVQTIGDIESMPASVVKALKSAIEHTKNNTKATLTVALNYGGQSEITRAAKRIAEKVKEGSLEVSDIDQNTIKENLYTQDIPDVDLLIRTSGESRISNFLLWQIAYAELYFTDVLWPDFRKEHFMNAIREYSSRERRYGKTGEQVKPEKKEIKE